MLKPERHNVSVERAEFVAIFEEGRSFDAGRVREAVKKAGFTYLGMEIVARGQIVSRKARGTTEWLLVDKKTSTVLRLVPPPDSPVLQQLVGVVSESRESSVQARGRVLETKEAVEAAEKVDAQVTLAVTAIVPAERATVPSLTPAKSGTEEKDGWF